MRTLLTRPAAGVLRAAARLQSAAGDRLAAAVGGRLEDASYRLGDTSPQVGLTGTPGATAGALRTALGDMSTALYRVSVTVTSSARPSRVLHAAADMLDRAGQGWAPSDTWNLDVFLTRRLADALDEAVVASDATSDYLLLGDVADRLRILASLDGFWAGSPLSPDPFAAGQAGWVWLADNTGVYAAAPSVRAWAGLGAETVAYLADHLHGYPLRVREADPDPDPDPDPEVLADQWAAELRAVSARLRAWSEGDLDEAGPAMAWLSDMWRHLWD